MSVFVFDCNTQQPMNRFDHHSEFVTGLDFSMFNEGQLATASWDKSVGTFSIDENPKVMLKAAGLA
jgi:WD40 repeat protein